MQFRYLRRLPTASQTTTVLPVTMPVPVVVVDGSISPEAAGAGADTLGGTALDGPTLPPNRLDKYNIMEMIVARAPWDTGLPPSNC